MERKRERERGWGRREEGEKGKGEGKGERGENRKGWKKNNNYGLQLTILFSQFLYVGLIGLMVNILYQRTKPFAKNAGVLIKIYC